MQENILSGNLYMKNPVISTFMAKCGAEERQGRNFNNHRAFIAVSEIVCHGPNITTCHHQLRDDSRLRQALAAQNKHTTRKYNISARVPRGNDGIWAHFFFFPLQKVRPNSIVTPGYPSRYVVLTCCMLVLYCECQATA